MTIKILISFSCKEAKYEHTFVRMQAKCKAAIVYLSHMRNFGDICGFTISFYFCIMKIKANEGEIMVEHILRASKERCWIVSIVYMSDKGISERDIKVLNIEGDRMTAYCYLKNEIRSFRISNVLSASWRNRHKKVV